MRERLNVAEVPVVARRRKVLLPPRAVHGPRDELPGPFVLVELPGRHFFTCCGRFSSDALLHFCEPSIACSALSPGSGAQDSRSPSRGNSSTCWPRTRNTLVGRTWTSHSLSSWSRR